MDRIDLNCDLGESYGAFKIGMDSEMLKLVTSANIACGFHGGDPGTMHKTVSLALEHETAIGAHPGLPDLIGFGRRRMDITAREAYDMMLYQVGALNAFVNAQGGRMQHVKPHGALYNMAAKNRLLADAIAEATCRIDPELILFGPSGSELIKAASTIGLRTACEVFADRTYQQDGTLTPRSELDAMITDRALAIGQVILMVQDGVVRCQQGFDIPIVADTICIHGDNDHAVLFAKDILQQLEAVGIQVMNLSGTAR